MNNGLFVLMLTAGSMGFLHTILGPDHYLPFIAMGKARNWSLLKTSVITFLCGIGHVGSSVVLGVLGIILGIGVSRIKFIESFRGDIAAWFIIAFGLVYFVWGLRRSLKKKAVEPDAKKKSLTPWILFIIFVLGPCEPLIPLLMYPAAKYNFFGAIMVAFVFSLTTIATMMTIVAGALFNVNLLSLNRFERYMHPMAGALILFCGIGIKFLGF